MLTNAIMNALPAIVLLPCDIKDVLGSPFQAVGRKYTDAVRLGSKAMPVCMPVGGVEHLEQYLDIAHGVLFPGSRANVHPSHFGQAVHNTALPLDTDRDTSTLPLLHAVIRRGIPLLAICRGVQELNVALGGSLHQAIQELPGKFDHREREGAASVQYAPAHGIELVAGGVMHKLFGKSEIQVNSLHGQGIDLLADGLTIEARAPDGIIEAVSVTHAKAFALGVQFHPEWDIENNPVGQVIFKAFGEACAQYAQQKQQKS